MPVDDTPSVEKGMDADGSMTMPYLVHGSVRIVPGDIYTDKGGTTVKITRVRYDSNGHGRVTTAEVSGNYRDEWFAGDVADYIMRGVWRKL